MTKKLENNLYKKIDSLREQFIKYEMASNYEKAEEVLVKAWDLLPKPQFEYDESFHITSYLIDTYINLERLEEAQKWADRIFKCNLDRHDAGEREYLAGKVAFEMGNYDVAKEYFKIVDEKSKGRIFQQGDIKYYKFFKKK